MVDGDVEPLIAQIRKRWSQIRQDTYEEEAFLRHLRSLGRWGQEPMDYPDVTAPFPETIFIAYSVCHPECGSREFIVEGSTQECQRCGGLMFRNETRQYRLVADPV